MPAVAEKSKKGIPNAAMAASSMVGIGGLELVRPPERLKTVLGSCVGIVICDPRSKIAGLAHSILPEGCGASAEPGKFADQAVDTLIARLVEAGARRNGLQSKLIGGARMFGSGATATLGDRNTTAARQRLEHHNIPITGEAIGGSQGRRVLVDPETARVDVEVIGQSKITI